MQFSILIKQLKIWCLVPTSNILYSFLNDAKNSNLLLLSVSSPEEVELFVKSNK